MRSLLQRTPRLFEARAAKPAPWFGPAAGTGTDDGTQKIFGRPQAACPEGGPLAPLTVELPREHSCGLSSCSKRHTLRATPYRIPSDAAAAVSPSFTLHIPKLPPPVELPADAVLRAEESAELVAASKKKKKRLLLKKKKKKEEEEEAKTEEEEALDAEVEATTRRVLLAKQRKAVEEFRKSKRYDEARSRVEALPITQGRDRIEKLLEDRVSLVAGATGCGKSTQVPQMILDGIQQEGSGRHVWVTQPRRVAAVALAERVAWERGEEVGASVGYHVSEEKVVPEWASTITFFTTGTLNMLLMFGEVDLNTIHVVVDEVHERSIDSDFLLLLLREGMRENPQMKVTLMSATVDYTPFENYFSEFSVGSDTFDVKPYPITEVYLDDTPTLADVARACAKNDDTEEIYVSDVSAEAVAKAVAWCLNPSNAADILNVSTQGDVLVFLSGLRAINNAAEELERRYGSTGRLNVVCMHSTASADAYHAMMAPSKRGVTKVILATNVAESSLTVDGVTVVINSGLAKEPRLGKDTSVQLLSTVRCSVANNRQRAGRAGRVAAGGCLHLFSRATSESLLQHPMPGIRTESLDALVLRVARVGCFGFANAYEALAQCIDPPSRPAIAAGIASLITLGALKESNGTHTVTTLGKRMARLPIEPRLAKLILFGAASGCFMPAITLAATTSVCLLRDIYKPDCGTPVPEEMQSPSDVAQAIYGFLEVERVTEGRMDTSLQRKVLGERDRLLRRARSSGVFVTKQLSSVLSADGTCANRNWRKEFVLRAVLVSIGSQLFRVGDTKGTAMMKDNCRVKIRPSASTVRAARHTGPWGVCWGKRELKRENTYELIAPSFVSPFLLCTMTPNLAVVRRAQETHVTLVAEGWAAFELPRKDADVLLALRRVLQKDLANLSFLDATDHWEAQSRSSQLLLSWDTLCRVETELDPRTRHVRERRTFR